jgi:tetratricopeptide (TPR) repeat protein
LHTAGWAVAELHPKFEISNLQSAIEQPPSPCPPAPLLSAPSLADPESLSPSPQSPIPARSAAGGPSPQSLLEQARELADRGNLEEARGLCEAALAQDRLDSETHILLAAICQEMGEIRAALEALRRALYLDPDSAAANFLLGTLLLRMGEPGKGQRCLETVVGLLSPMPRDEPVHRGDGLTAGRLLEIARSHLEISGRRPGAVPQAVTSDPSDKSERRLSAQRSS